jgi:hypothetical protein
MEVPEAEETAMKAGLWIGAVGLGLLMAAAGCDGGASQGASGLSSADNMVLNMAADELDANAIEDNESGGHGGHGGHSAGEGGGDNELGADEEERMEALAPESRGGDTGGRAAEPYRPPPPPPPRPRPMIP